jgi:rhodanese-related sulfurtransferase
MKKRVLLLLLSSVLLSAGGTASAYDVQGLLPEQAYDYLEDYDNAYLIDVRTPAEYFWIGHPETNLADDPDSGFLEGKFVNIPFMFWVYDKHTDDYVMKIAKKFPQQVARTFPEGSILIFICRSGGRSALAQQYMMDPANSKQRDYEKILTYEMYNLDEGFEGGRDGETGHRTLDAGWRNKDLPYKDKGNQIWTPRFGHDDEGSDE